MHPVLSSDSFRGPRTEKIPSLFDVGPALLFTSGRFGLAKALQLAAVSRGDEVLLPAFNCPAMVAPIRWLGAKPVFYRIDASLAIDVAELSHRVNSRTKCLIVVHYFGFIQELTAARKLCDDRGILLIEDCAHSFFGTTNNTPVGSYGDFAFGSLMKFFPIYDGGCLVSKRIGSGGSLRSGGVKFELKSCLDAIERAHDYRRLPFRRALDAAFNFKNAIRRRITDGNRPAIGPAAVDGGYAFEDDWLDIRMSRFSRWIINRVNRARLVESRRRNYMMLLERTRGLDACEALAEDLPDGVVPYVFPLRVKEHDRVFKRLKESGVPMLRWEDAVTTGCAVSERYSRQLFLFACHQELSPEDIEWIASEVATALRCK